MSSDTTYYRRNLPHYQTKEAIYSVVFRLDGSLPIDVVVRLQEEGLQQENAMKKNNEKNAAKNIFAALREEYFHKYDSILDSSTTGPHWLNNDAVAKITADAIHFLNSTRYTLVAYCIMPNHVHLIISLDVKNLKIISTKKMPYVLTRILHSLKRHTALESNRILHRTGAFWQHESYDHIIRDSSELRRTVEYVINNPVASKFVKRWEEWKWTYVNTEWLEKNL